MGKSYAIGLDYGTESARALLVDVETGEILGQAQRRYLGPHHRAIGAVEVEQGQLHAVADVLGDSLAVTEIGQRQPAADDRGQGTSQHHSFIDLGQDAAGQAQGREGFDGLLEGLDLAVGRQGEQMPDGEFLSRQRGQLRGDARIAVAQGVREVVDEDYLAYRIGQVARVGRLRFRSRS